MTLKWAVSQATTYSRLNVVRVKKSLEVCASGMKMRVQVWVCGVDWVWMWGRGLFLTHYKQRANSIRLISTCITCKILPVY